MNAEITYRLDFGRLFAFINGNPTETFFVMGNEPFPKLYGSEPPRLDSLWNLLKEMDVGLNIFRKNPLGKEKRVDSALIIDCMKLIYSRKTSPDGEIVILAGDADYYDMIHEVTAAGWKVRVVC